MKIKADAGAPMLPIATAAPDGGYSEDMGMPAYPTAQAEYIMMNLVPEWERMFLKKNAKYRAVGNDLGARGVFPDINRKVGILKDRLWDGNGERTGDEDDDTRRVIYDLIGHLFLMQCMMDSEEN